MRLTTIVPLLLLAVLPCMAAGARAADDGVVVADFTDWLTARGVPPGWELKVRSGKASYEIVRDDGMPALHLKSSNSSYSLQGSVNVDVRRYPVLSWKWKAVQLPRGGDFRRPDADDQAAQLFVAFSKTKAIVYIWDTTAPVGATDDTSPVPFMHVHVVVVRSGAADLGTWITETRNVAEDYRKLFGGEPPAVSGMRIQINTQHTGTSAESWFADVKFRKQ